MLFQDSSFSEVKNIKIVDGPRIFIAQKVKDFGDVNHGAVVEQEFEVQNTGTKDLIIRSLNPACGCTSAVINEPTIKPGNKSYIRLSFNTTGFRGRKEKVLRIYSNDPLDSSEVVTIKANVLQDIVTDPEILELGEVVRRKGFKKKLSVASPFKSNFNIIEVISKSNFISSEIESDKLGSSHVVNVFSKDRLPLGNIRTKLVIKTDSKVTPSIVVPISLYVVGDLVISPRTVNFGFIKKSSSSEGQLTRVLRVSKFTEALNARIEYVEKSNRDINVDLSEDATGQYVTLSLGSLAKGVVRGTLKLFSNSEIEDEKLLEVPYFAVIDTDAN